MPRDVELGYHLCYGDAAHRHFVQPPDTALLTRVGNALAAGAAPARFLSGAQVCGLPDPGTP